MHSSIVANSDDRPNRESRRSPGRDMAAADGRIEEKKSGQRQSKSSLIRFDPA
jgi:hypothetical protein